MGRLNSSLVCCTLNVQERQFVRLGRACSFDVTQNMLWGVCIITVCQLAANSPALHADDLPTLDSLSQSMSSADDSFRAHHNPVLLKDKEGNHHAGDHQAAPGSTCIYVSHTAPQLGCNLQCPSPDMQHQVLHRLDRWSHHHMLQITMCYLQSNLCLSQWSQDIFTTPWGPA